MSGASAGLKYKTKSLEEALDLAAAFRHVAQALYDAQQKTESKRALRIGLNSKTADGKTTFANAMVNAIAGDAKRQDAEADSLFKENVPGQAQPVAKHDWHRVVLPEAGREVRVFDEASNIADMNARTLPGIDFPMNTKPGSVLDAEIKISRSEDGNGRVVDLIMPFNVATELWKNQEFLTQAQKYALPTWSSSILSRSIKSSSAPASKPASP
jgi:hypothetical protein